MKKPLSNLSKSPQTIPPYSKAALYPSVSPTCHFYVFILVTILVTGNKFENEKLNEHFLYF